MPPIARKKTVEVDVQDMNWIKKALEDLKVKVDTIEKTTSKLDTTIVGDPNYGHEGLIAIVKEHQEYIHEDKKFKSKLVGGSIVLGTLWTALVAYLSNHK
jgi:hypothetical protein